MSALIRRVAIALLRSALAVLALGAAAAAPAAPLTLAIADTPLFAPALIAEAQGYYRGEGLDIKIVHCVNGKRCLQHLTDGEAQVATVADTPIVMAAHAGSRFDIVATFGTSRENRLIGRTDRGVRTVADLKGKRIGFVKGTTGHYFTNTFLVFNNIDPRSVTMVPLEAGEMITQLVEGRIDAAGLYQPHAHYAAMKLGNNAVVLPSPRFYTVTANLVSVPAAAGLADGDLVKILRALKRACAFIDEQPMQAKATLAARLHVDAALIDASWSDYDYRLRLDQSLITGLEAESRWALREALVPRGPVPDYLERMRLGPLRTVDQRAVSIVN